MRGNSTARSRRNRGSVRAGSRMSQKRAYLIGSFWRENMLEFAGLLLDFRLAVHRQAIGEQALGQTVAANDAPGPLAAARGQLDDHRSVPDRGGHGLQGIMTRIHKWLVIMCLRRVWRCGY